MTDDFGRRYVEVPPFPPELATHFGGLTPDECVECGKLVRHGIDRYFQRNDKEDGSPEQIEKLGGREVAEILAVLIYDTVCADCGHDALRHPKVE